MEIDTRQTLSGQKTGAKRSEKKPKAELRGLCGQVSNKWRNPGGKRNRDKMDPALIEIRATGPRLCLLSEVLNNIHC